MSQTKLSDELKFTIDRPAETKVWYTVTNMNTYEVLAEICDIRGITWGISGNKLTEHIPFFLEVGISMGINHLLIVLDDNTAVHSRNTSDAILKYNLNKENNGDYSY